MAALRYGLGDADGIFIFFVWFGVMLMALVFALGGSNLYYHGHVPLIITMAQAHSLSISTIMSRYANRELARMQQWASSYLGLDRPRVRTRDIAAVWRWRISHRRPPSPGHSTGWKEIEQGALVELSIAGVYPHVTCFVRFDAAAFALRWTHESFVSLHTIVGIRLVEGTANGWSTSWERSHGAVTFGSIAPAAARGGRKSICIDFHNSLHTGMCTLELRLAGSRADRWYKELQSLQEASASVLCKNGTDVRYLRWCMGCMRKASNNSAGCFVRRSEFDAVLKRANSDLRGEALSEALSFADVVPLSTSLPLDAYGRFNIAQVTGALVQLATAQPEIKALFDQYSNSGHLGKAEWLAFMRMEQLAASSSELIQEVSGIAGTTLDDHNRTMLQAAAATFDEASGLLSGMGGALSRFALLLLSPDNDAVAPPLDMDISQPLAHYWCACSHNSYIVGDQVTHTPTTPAPDALQTQPKHTLS